MREQILHNLKYAIDRLKYTEKNLQSRIKDLEEILVIGRFKEEDGKNKTVYKDLNSKKLINEVEGVLKQYLRLTLDRFESGYCEGGQHACREILAIIKKEVDNVK